MYNRSIQDFRNIPNLGLETVTMEFPLLKFQLLLILDWLIIGILGSIDGTFNPFKRNYKNPEENPCNPLYWYPKELPEYCYIKSTPGPDLPRRVIPIPIPVPVPAPAPIPVIPPPPPIPLPFGVPLIPTNPFLPVAGVPYTPQQYPAPPFPSYPVASVPYPPLYPGYPQKPVGFLPGIPELVSPGGGINVLPFSDVYSDMIEKHKQKIIRIRLQKLLDKYDKYPYRPRKNSYDY